MLKFISPDRHGYSVKFSPHNANHLLLASSQLYGLAGGGTLYMLELEERGVSELCRFEWTDGLFDVSWCPYAKNIAATASGDGSLQIWDSLVFDAAEAKSKAQDNSPKTKPIACLQEHKNEVYSIEWNNYYHQILSSSWDGSIKLWDCNRKASLSTHVGHSDLVYCAKFSPLIANIFLSVGTDGKLILWNSFDFSGKPLMTISAAHDGEVLACDWSQFDRNVLVTGGSDGLVRGWDLRNMRHHLFELYAGEFAVRRLTFSQTTATTLASANYDFTTRIWDYKKSLNALEVRENHTEFVCGIDWNPNRPHQLADCGWDSVMNIYTPESFKG